MNDSNDANCMLKWRIAVLFVILLFATIKHPVLPSDSFDSRQKWLTFTWLHAATTFNR